MACGRQSDRRIVAEYSYVDGDGVLISQAVRYAPKDFRQRRPDGTGGWIWNLRGIQVVPYNLPNVIKAIAAGETIAIVEGEKDVENLRKVGITATCNAGGAGKWKRDHSEYLRGAKAIILPDNDDPGRSHAKQVAASLKGIAACVSILDLPGLPDKGDVSDWLTRGGTREEFDLLVAEPAKSVDEGIGTLLDAGFWARYARITVDLPYVVKGVVHRGQLVVFWGGTGLRQVVQRDRHADVCWCWGSLEGPTHRPRCCPVCLCRVVPPTRRKQNRGADPRTTRAGEFRSVCSSLGG